MLDAPVVTPEVVTPDTKKPGRFASLPKWVKILIIAIAAFLALGIIGSLSKDPIPAAAPTRFPAPVVVTTPTPVAVPAPPVAAPAPVATHAPVALPTSASTISDAKLHQLALGMAWDQQGASAQSDMCFAATTMGYSWAANTIVTGSGNAFTVSEVTSFLHSKC